MTPARLAMARAFFDAHGGKVVFLGRFVTGLRTWGGFIAGSNLMSGPRFLVMNVLGGVAWAVTNGLGYFYFGDVVSNASTGVDVALAIAGIAMWIGTVLLVRKRARNLRMSGDHAPRGAAD